MPTTDVNEFLIKGISQAQQNAGAALELARSAKDTAERCLIKTTENEDRLKSEQHRIAKMEDKFDQVMVKLDTIENQQIDNGGMLKGIKISIKVLVGLITLVSTIAGIVVAIQKIWGI